MVALGVLLLLVLACFCSSIIADQYNSPSSPYAYIVAKQNHRSLHRWDEVIVSVLNDTAHREIIRKEVLSPGIVPPSYFVPQPVYVSMTTISIRIDSIYKSVLILIQGRIVPTHIYLCISEEPFLLDKGITSIPDNLLSLVAAKYLTIVYTQNIGSHRKLLPVLKRYWGQDVFIATVDDDIHERSGGLLLYRLLKQYSVFTRHREDKDYVVALRARRIGTCQAKPYPLTTYAAWVIVNMHNCSEMLLVPTGCGGILYKPSYFHEVVFDDRLREATKTADDLTFRLVTLMMGIPVLLGCAQIEFKSNILRRCEEDDVDRRFNMYYNMSSVDESVPMEVLLNELKRKAMIKYRSTQQQRRRLIGQRASYSLSNTTMSLVKKSTDLYAINQRGGNDQCWDNGARYLAEKGLLRFPDIVGKHISEREPLCFRRGLTHRQSRTCSVWECPRWNKDIYPILS